MRDKLELPNAETPFNGYDFLSRGNIDSDVYVWKENLVTDSYAYHRFDERLLINIGNNNIYTAWRDASRWMMEKLVSIIWNSFIRTKTLTKL